MAQFNDTQEFTYLENTESLMLITNRVSTGTLAIHTFDGSGWVLTDTISSTGAVELYVKGQKIRFTPANGMLYSIPEGT